MELWVSDYIRKLRTIQYVSLEPDIDHRWKFLFSQNMASNKLSQTETDRSVWAISKTITCSNDQLVSSDSALLICLQTNARGCAHLARVQAVKTRAARLATNGPSYHTLAWQAETRGEVWHVTERAARTLQENAIYYST